MPIVLDDAAVIQAIGLVGTLGGVTWPMFATRLGMLLGQLFTNLCFLVHFALLGADTATLVNVLSALQVAAAIPLGTRPGFRHVYLATVPLIAATLLWSWNGMPSVFAALGAGLISLGRYQTEVVRFRLVMLLALPCWFVHNALVGSIPGMISDMVGFGLNVMMLVRMGALRRRAA